MKMNTKRAKSQKPKKRKLKSRQKFLKHKGANTNFSVKAEMKLISDKDEKFSKISKIAFPFKQNFKSKTISFQQKTEEIKSQYSTPIEYG